MNPRRPLPALATGGIVGALAAGGCGWGAYELAVSRETDSTGATAAVIGEVSSTLYGVAFGLFVGALVTLALARRIGPSLGLLSALLAAALVALGTALLSTWFDWWVAVVLLVLALFPGLLAAGVAAIPSAFRKGADR